MPPSQNWLWTAPIFPGGVQWMRSPYKLLLSLADFFSRSQIPAARAHNRARHSNNKTRAPDAPLAGLAVNESPPRLRHELSPFEQELDRMCDKSSLRSMPVPRMRRRMSGRALLPAQIAAQPLLCRYGVCPDA